MRQWDVLICQAWYVGCSVNWAALGVMVTTAAVLMARKAWQVARQADLNSAARTAARNRRDGMALGKALQSELAKVSASIARILPPTQDTDEEMHKYLWAVEHRDRFDTPILRSVITGLGCYDEELGIALGHCLSHSDLIRESIPHGVVPRERTAQARRIMSGLWGCLAQNQATFLTSGKLLDNYLLGALAEVAAEKSRAEKGSFVSRTVSKYLKIAPF